MKNTKMNFQKELRNASAVFMFMLISSISWAQLNNMKFTKGSGGQTAFEFERAFMNDVSFLGGIRFYSDNFDKGKLKTSNKGSRMTFELRKYFNGGRKSMNGIYLAPNISLGRHQVTYEYDPNPGVGLTLFSVGASLITQNANYLALVPEEKEIVTGEGEVTSGSLGLKIGYQKRWDIITFDIGMNLTKNTIRGSENQGMRLSNGKLQEYNDDIHGSYGNLYFGMGFAF